MPAHAGIVALSSTRVLPGRLCRLVPPLRRRFACAVVQVREQNQRGRSAAHQESLLLKLDHRDEAAFAKRQTFAQAKPPPRTPAQSQEPLPQGPGAQPPVTGLNSLCRREALVPCLESCVALQVSPPLRRSTSESIYLSSRSTHVGPQASSVRRTASRWLAPSNSPQPIRVP